MFASGHTQKLQKPNQMSLWLLKELSKITMPIAFNEPLSFLQRITEYMEHVYLIHRASNQSQPLERMQVGIHVTLRTVRCFSCLTD